MSQDPGRDDADVTETPVAYGWGGIIMRDGVGWPMPEEMALELALPRWAEEVPDTDSVVDLCFRALQHDSVSLQVVALETLAQAAARPEPLPRLAEVRRAIQRVLDSDDPRLRAAGEAARAAVLRHER
ncbi:MAG: hypothetical protein AVDCRST_MAG89-3258 [uncultured Gemmatimonadetes bacterium]|uniref:HEAT repeat domain-containing protein n=1 Tax=uncultured Gemmatimonadota bacterium TaxID=203437 RepID=A0A6J4M9J9_9BACT|nr:MAG: hypothetical protein AVDCRST_MAG89-3258 [uncultured Gemmatimonadota bacterium]